MYDERHLDLLRWARLIQRDPARRGVLPTGLLLSVALILNRPAWLKDEGYTLAEAINRVCLDGPDEIVPILRAARDLHNPSIK